MDMLFQKSGNEDYLMYANLSLATSNYYLRFAIIFPLLFPLLFLLRLSENRYYKQLDFFRPGKL